MDSLLSVTLMLKRNALRQKTMNGGKSDHGSWRKAYTSMIQDCPFLFKSVRVCLNLNFDVKLEEQKP